MCTIGIVVVEIGPIRPRKGVDTYGLDVIHVLLVVSLLDSLPGVIDRHRLHGEDQAVD